MNEAEYLDINRRMQTAWTKCQYALDIAGIHRDIDEMSVLLSPEELDSYRTIASEITGGMTHMEWFNGVEADTMTMERNGEGDGPAFMVRFEFFRPRDNGVGLPWRVEAMSVLDGFAPLHGDPLGRVVHASYKCHSDQTYEHDMKKLDEWGMTRIADYRNSYGKFSYWHNPEFPWGADEKPVYLKPRVNLRDAGM